MSTESLRWPPARCLIIAEIAQAHDGSLGMAHSYIDVAADSGAGGVKFQTHIAGEESTLREPWRVRFSRQDATRFDYWKRMEFSEEQWRELKQHADERALLFLSSPFSLKAVEMLERIGVAAWKIASGEVAHGALVERMLESGLPMLLSTGMSPWREIDRAVQTVKQAGCPLTILQCTSMYPTPLEKVGLNVIRELRSRYDTSVGLSDHSGTIYAGLAASVLGIDVLEVHLVFSRQTFSPDLEASVTAAGLRQLVDGVRAIETLLEPVDKDAMATELSPMRDLFTRSVVAARDLRTGEILAAGDLALKKPGTGLSAEELTNLVGRRLVCDVEADELVTWEDVR